MHPYEFLLLDIVELNDDLRHLVRAEPVGVPQVDKHKADSISENTYYKFQISKEDDSKIRTHWMQIGSTRLRGHIQRLCDENRSEVENLFGLAVVLTYNHEESILPEVAIEEFKSCSWWWTISPYILYNLMSKGFPLELAFQSICEWGETANEWKSPLSGLEEDFEFFGNQVPILTIDSQNIKHKYANALAKMVIQNAEAFAKYRE